MFETKKDYNETEMRTLIELLYGSIAVKEQNFPLGRIKIRPFLLKKVTGKHLQREQYKHNVQGLYCQD